MSLIKIKNPEDKEITLNFKGEIHTIGAKSSQDFPEELAKHWLSIYQFMSIDEAKEEKVVKEEKTTSKSKK